MAGRLKPDEVKEIFITSPTANQELRGYTRRQFEGGSGDEEPEMFINMRRLTPIWSQSDSLTGLVAPTDEASIQLQAIEARLNQPETAVAAAREILELLVDSDPLANTEDVKFTFPETPNAGYFAEVAARTAMLRGEFELAQQLIDAGLAQEPWEQLNYLQRIMDRFAAPRAEAQ